MAWIAVEDEGAIRRFNEMTTPVVVEMSLLAGATDNSCSQERARL